MIVAIRRTTMESIVCGSSMRDHLDLAGRRPSHLSGRGALAAPRRFAAASVNDQGAPMDAGFASAVAEWHDFYAAVAGVSATLVGLLFVSLAINPLVMGDRRPAGLRTWAGQTFHNFLVVLTVSLVALIPQLSVTALVATLGVV